ncbi:hypothetical protein [Sphingomonas sp. MMS24-J13]|uniref:hypothetical protein n=1 Tax=Sphingomonas sp. MMS24-J13 TaxID=3238686 RepID=UPI00384EC403
MKTLRLAAGVAALAAAFSFSSAAPCAETPWAWAVRVLDSQDLATLHPLIQELLQVHTVGTALAWKSPSGKSGFVHLDSGGDQAGSADGTVRITKGTAGHEKQLFVFRYHKDPEMGWAIVG